MTLTGVAYLATLDEPPFQRFHELLTDALIPGTTFGEFSETSIGLIDARVDAVEQLEAWVQISGQLHSTADTQIGEAHDQFRLAARCAVHVGLASLSEVDCIGIKHRRW